MYDVADRDNFLKELGFDNYVSFLQSPLWKMLSEEILHRDSFRCRCRNCLNRARNIRPLSYNPRVLTGISSYCLVSVCKECKLECSNNPFLLTERVVGAKPKPGISKPSIGFWYKEQSKMNKPLRKKIVNKIQSLFPEIYSLPAFQFVLNS